MDKKNLKKAALLGLMIGAAAVSAPATAYEPVTSQGMTLAHGCRNGCGGGKGAIADADVQVQTTQQPGTSHSCGGTQAPQTTPKNGKAMPQASCSGAAMPQGTYYPNGQAPQSGCRASSGCRSNGY